MLHDYHNLSVYNTCDIITVTIFHQNECKFVTIIMLKVLSMPPGHPAGPKERSIHAPYIRAPAICSPGCLEGILYLVIPVILAALVIMKASSWEYCPFSTPASRFLATVTSRILATIVQWFTAAKNLDVNTGPLFRGKANDKMAIFRCVLASL